jgi:hypothetical protein
MLELYFLIYRIPRMMTRLARERNRSALGWTLIGIGSWIGAELLVGFALGIIHGLGAAIWGWPMQSSALNVLTYVLALVAALVSVSIVTRILRGKSAEPNYPAPPPPPSFEKSEQKALE